ncbi:MAG: acyl-CoA dehydrogenase family protein, partial [Acidimicrobiia bacterium]
MVIEATKSHEAIRAEVAEWLESNWDEKYLEDLVTWRGMLADEGWAVPHWPREWYGRGLPQSAVSVIGEEFRRVGAAGPAPGMGIWLFGPTLLEHGTDEQKKRWLRPAICGEEVWCQLFSEPGA